MCGIIIGAEGLVCMRSNLNGRSGDEDFGILAGHWPAECMLGNVMSTVRQRYLEPIVVAAAGTEARHVKNIRCPTYSSLSDFQYRILPPSSKLVSPPIQLVLESLNVEVGESDSSHLPALDGKNRRKDVILADTVRKLTGCKAASVKPRLSIGETIKLIGIVLFVSESLFEIGGEGLQMPVDKD